MMKKFLFVLLATAMIVHTNAQKGESKDYARMKEEITQKIFGTPDSLFESNTVPEQYKNESTVILAQKQQLESDANFKFKFGFFGSSSGNKFTFYKTFREKVFINDQSSLDDYSQLNFSKLQAKRSGYLGKMKNYSFMNIRLIKPNGTVKNIDVSESTVTLEEGNDKAKNKIAIPDLSIGDIIDYYVVNFYEEEGMVGSGGSTVDYLLEENYPIVNYLLSLQFNRRIAVEYQCINGAPDFDIIYNNQDGKTLNMKLNNVRKKKDVLWSCIARQSPIVRLRYSSSSIPRGNLSIVTTGDAEKTTGNANYYANKKKDELVSRGGFKEMQVAKIFPKERKEMMEYFNDLAKKQHKEITNQDSIVHFVYNYFLWSDFYNGYKAGTAYSSASFSPGYSYQIAAMTRLAAILYKEFEIEADFVIALSRNSFKEEDVFDTDDYSLLLRIKTANSKALYVCYETNLYFCGELPARFEGQSAKVFPIVYIDSHSGKRITVSHDFENIVLPVLSSYKENAEIENIAVAIDKNDMQLLHIKRVLSATGNYRRDEQEEFNVYEDVAKGILKQLQMEGDLVSLNEDRKKDLRMNEEELISLLAKAKKEQKEKFESNVQRIYESKPKAFDGYKIVQQGISPLQPVFQIEQNFSMEGWVKKAGNNYIVDAGRFIANQLEIKADQRNRKADLYMYCPRSFTYHIELSIPDAYTAEGLDKLYRKVENECGGFLSSATISDSKVMIDVSKYYKNGFEPAANWEKVAAFVDAASAFNKDKILLRKK